VTFPTILVLIAASGLGGRVRASPQTPCGAPQAPAAVSATVDGRTLTLTWRPAESALPTNYTVEIGDAPGSSYLGTIDTGVGRTSLTKEVDPGVYFVRVVAVNGCGTSAPSSELRVVVDQAHIAVRSTPDVIVARRTAARNTYFPTLTMLQSGELIVVYYDSPDHVSRVGRIAMARSGDEGRTWSTPTVVIDGPNDERDPNIIETARGTWLLSYFESDASKAPASQGVFVLRSTDRGRTWSLPIKVGTALAGACTSAKIVQLENGDLLMPIYGTKPAGADYIASTVRSGDDGVTWPAESEVTLAGAPGVSFVEPALGYLGGGRLLAMIRTEGRERVAYETTSIDGGRSWAVAARTTLVAQASDLLHVADGDRHFLVHAWSDTSGRFGDSRPTVMQIVRFRDFPRARWTGEPRLLYQGHCWSDEGYPSSVRLRDGRLFTVYYDACAGYIGGTFSKLLDPAAAADCSDAPGAARLELVSNAEGNVTFAWTSADTARMSYMLEAGTAPGAADALAADVGPATTYRVSQVKPGTYYVRVRASNACGSGPASNEAVVVVP
jgi:hypothetical protein